MRCFRLEGHTPVVCTYLEWARWAEASEEERIVLRSQVGDALVSTVFLGLDHNYVGKGPPLLFETMIFGGPHDGLCWRYSTWEAAERGHGWAIALLGNRL